MDRARNIINGLDPLVPAGHSTEHAKLVPGVVKNALVPVQHGGGDLGSHFQDRR